MPGETPADQSDDALTAAAERVGFPVLIKPAAGGGGIGMKAVRDAAALADALAAARREAKASFGNDTLYVERLIEQPRHVEIQVFADAHGNTVHVFERECSAQRRHQKVIEESPCPALSAAVRERMGAAAIAAAKAVGYRNAGTCEFLLEGSGDSAQFLFPRDEHAPAGRASRDRVRRPASTWCTRNCASRRASRCPSRRTSLSQRGHAIECRIYAEDPAQGFIPQAGPILLYREPQGPGIRVDSGVKAGSEVSVHYDPMLAKLIVHAIDSRRRATPRDHGASRITPSSASAPTSRSCCRFSSIRSS